MGIFRAGVRVTRALTPTPLSSSSDDEELRVKKKCKTRRIAARVSDAGAPHHPHVDDVFQVADCICQFPGELFELPDLGEVLSLHAWNDCLSEEERKSLCSYLPDMDQESYKKTLKELFGGGNFHFGSPLEDLWQCLKDGMCDPNVVSAHQALMTLQRKEHYHCLRQYHNSLVNSLLEMRDLWLNDPEANLEERLNSWHAWKSKALLTGTHDVVLDSGKAHLKGNLKVKTSSKHRGGGEGSKSSSGDQSLELAQPLHSNAEGLVYEGHLIRFLNSESAPEVFEEGKLQKTTLSMKEEQSHLDAFSVRSPVNCESEGTEKKKQGNTGSGSKHKRENETREAAHGLGMSVEEMGRSQVKAKSSPDVKLPKAQNKSEQAKKEDRQAKGCSMENNIRVLNAYEDGQLSPVLNTEQGSKVVVREPPSGAWLKKFKSSAHEVEESSSSPFRDSLSDDPTKLMRKGGLPLVPPSASAFPFSILHLISAGKA